MSVETRNSTALSKRAEQLVRWENSATNSVLIPEGGPPASGRRIKFPSGCVFLAACAAADKDEVLLLLDRDADINTPNVDGLTALHQACIDDNLEMVEFLVGQGADVNRGDNEGWTPLHATVSCGFASIARFLIEHGADVGLVNCDGDLPIDIADTPEMIDMLQTEIDAKGINPEEARNAEKRLMLRDAKEWLATNSTLYDCPSPKSGATPLHVAAAKGYLDVMKVLLQCGSDVDKQDVDGWTAMHAAAYWGQKESAQMLVENFADMEAKNFVGQTPFDVADSDMFRFLESIKQKQNKEEVNRRLAKKKLEARDIHSENETPSKVKKVDLEIQDEQQKAADNIGMMEVSSESETESSSTSTSSSADSEAELEEAPDEKKNRVNSSMDGRRVEEEQPVQVMAPPPSPPKTTPAASGDDAVVQDWRRPTPGRQVRPEIRSSNSFKSSELGSDKEVTLRRTPSYQNDPVFYAKKMELKARIQANSLPNQKTPTIPSCQRQISSSLEAFNKEEKVESTNESTTTSTTTSTTNSPSKIVSSSPVSSPQPNTQILRSGEKKLPAAPTTNGDRPPMSLTAVLASTNNNNSRLTMIKNFFKSFAPPVRDEESETQRKAHAKRVRETRRSTQGVTLEEIKSAEQYVKNNCQTMNNNNNNNNEQSNGANGVSVSATITTAVPTVTTRESVTADETTAPTTTVAPSAATQERRTYYRLSVDNGSKFKLEDATKVADPPTTHAFVRRPIGSTAPRPSSAPIDTADATITLPLQKPRSVEEKEQDKENDARNALTTQATIHKKRRQKRRSTGVVIFDNMDDIEADKDTTGGGDFDDTSKLNHQESGTERSSSRGSRLGSSNDLALRGENGEIDYKKLYEKELSEKEKLKDKLRKSEDELKDTKLTLEKLNTVTSKNSLSELEKRERRAMERKLSEMEEELKQLQKLKAENERLRTENRALTRVVTKLSNSANK